MARSTSERLVWWGSLVGALLFFSWAYFQRNDPDVALWASIYGLGGLFCALYLLDRLAPPVAGFYALALAAYACYLAFLVVGQHEPIFEEHGREMLGGFVTAAWMAVLYRYAAPNDADRRGP